MTQRRDLWNGEWFVMVDAGGAVYAPAGVLLLDAERSRRFVEANPRWSPVAVKVSPVDRADMAGG